MATYDDLLICTACGTQFEESDPQTRTTCPICDDPRQFVPPTGQSFTTLRSLTATNHSNARHPIPSAPNLTSIRTEPQVGIGQRAVLIQTPAGNVLWDCLTFLDAPTVAWITGLGGLAAIVISHPHYYSTHTLWGETFRCPVYVSREDEQWLVRPDGHGVRRFIERGVAELRIPGKDGADTGVVAVKLGGHFPGSLVCLTGEKLLIADTLVTTPSGRGDWKERGRPKGMNSFVFMWSIPNMIPLPPDEIAKMWKVLKDHEFTSTHGAFLGTDIIADDVKGRVLESMKIQIRGEGYTHHELLLEGWPGAK